jgi:negative regulator of flagellin synthesis FlgM
MKVNGSNIKGSGDIGYETKISGTSKENSSVAGANVKTDPNTSYKVSLSEEAKSRQESMEKALSIAKNTSPVQEDKISALKSQIQSGAYKPDAHQIAAGIMRESAMDWFAENTSEKTL